MEADAVGGYDGEDTGNDLHDYCWYGEEDEQGCGVGEDGCGSAEEVGDGGYDGDPWPLVAEAEEGDLVVDGNPCLPAFFACFPEDLTLEVGRGDVDEECGCEGDEEGGTGGHLVLGGDQEGCGGHRVLGFLWVVPYHIHRV